MTVTRVTTRGEAEAHCPFHDDTHPSFYINLESGLWICHAGCGAGTFLQLLERLGQAPDRPVMEWRGLTREMMDRWGIVWAEERGAMEIPAFDAQGKFVGRIWRYEDKQPKYQYSEGFPRRSILFGLSRLGRVKEVYIGEGPLDAIWLQEAGLPGVACLGSRLTQEQGELLLDMGVGKVTLVPDQDAVGRAGAEASSYLLKKLGIWVFVAHLPYKDPKETPLGELKELVMRNRRLCVNGTGLVKPHLRRWLNV